MRAWTLTGNSVIVNNVEVVLMCPAYSPLDSQPWRVFPHQCPYSPYIRIAANDHAG
jgi:hypothetical protein